MEKNILYFCIIVCVTFVSSCVGLETKRVVKDNIFYSSDHPRIKIKIHPDFKYTEGKTKHSTGVGSYETLRSASVKRSEYEFTGGGNVDKVVRIFLSKLTTDRWYFFPTYLKNIKNKLSFGTEEINGEKYTYCVFAQSFDSGPCRLVRAMDRTVSAKSDRRIEIYYAENIGNLYTCKDWVDVNLLSTEQHSRLKNFLNDYKRNIQYFEYTDIEESQELSSADIFSDKNTGLEWFAGPDRDTNWNEAKQWVENLTVDGGGWRMPMQKELKALYKKGVGTRNMIPLLKTTGWWIWSGETKDSSSAWGFDFRYGAEDCIDHDGFYTDIARGFAVRSRR